MPMHISIKLRKRKFSQTISQTPTFSRYSMEIGRNTLTLESQVQNIEVKTQNLEGFFKKERQQQNQNSKFNEESFSTKCKSLWDMDFSNFDE